MRTPTNEPLRHRNPLPFPSGEGLKSSERRCILTGAHGPRAGLVRLALSPDGLVLPDVHARAPGRGAWIGVSRGELDQALAKGRLKAALARAFKTGALDIPADIPARIEAALRRALADRLGLEMRSGTLILGTQRIADTARAGGVALLLHAIDASEDGRKKLDQAWRVGAGREGSGDRGLILPLDRAALSVALGRDNVVHLALADSKAAGRVNALLQRLLIFLGAPIPAETGPGTGPTETGTAEHDAGGERTPLRPVDDEI